MGKGKKGKEGEFREVDHLSFPSAAAEMSAGWRIRCISSAASSVADTRYPSAL